MSTLANGDNVKYGPELLAAVGKLMMPALARRGAWQSCHCETSEILTENIWHALY